MIVGRRRGRRHRLHGLAADLEPRVRGPGARGGEARRAGRGRPRVAAGAGRCSARSARLPARGAGAPARAAPPTTSRPLRRRRPRARPHPRRRGRAGDAGRVRRLRVPVLRPGGGRDPRAARLVRRRPALRLAPPAAQRRPPERPDGGRGGRGGGRAGRVLGDARPAARPPGRAARRATCAATPRSSGSTSTASARSCAAASTSPRIAEDVASADASGVAGTPTFFINGRRHSGAYDIDTLTAAVRAARARNRSLRAVSGT